MHVIGRTLLLTVLAIVLAEVSAFAQSPTSPPRSSAEHVIRVGDVLKVRVWPDETLSGEFAVEGSGNVYLPLVGEFKASGLAHSEVQRKVRELYVQAGMKSPVISITPVFAVAVFGGVRSPGIFPTEPTHTVLDVIARAGGFTPRARTEDVRIVRNGATIPFNARTALEQGSVESLTLQSGDRVVVGERSSFPWQTVLMALQFGVTIALAIQQFGTN